MTTTRGTLLKDLVKGTVTFWYYQDGNLWYQTESGFAFPVPVGDCGTARFASSDRGIMYMKWIKRQMEQVNDDRS